MNTRQEARAWLIGMIFLLAMPLLAQEPEKKAQVPDAAAQFEAMKLVKEVYGEKWAKAKTSGQKTALAEKLLQKASESKADPANHYVLLKLARDVAAQAGDVDLALRAVDEMASAYQVEAYAMKVETLVKAAKAASVAKQYPVIVERAKVLLDEAVAKDDFEVAASLGEVALEAAKSGKDAALVKQMVDRNKDVEEIRKVYKEVKGTLAILEKKPADPEANLAVGKYLCLMKGQWDRGLPKLALGGDETLKRLAVKELEEASDANAQAALGDGWWELAEKEEGTGKKHFQGRAAFWYRKALPGLAGLVKDKVEKRLTAAQPSRPESKGEKCVDLFNGRNLKGWHHRNPNGPRCWSVVKGELMGVGQGRNDLMTDQIFQDFELHAEFLLGRNANSGIYLRGRYEIQLWDEIPPKTSDGSCGAIYGLIAPTKQAYLGPGRWNTLDVRLVGRQVCVAMNGEQIIDSQNISRPTGGALDTLEDQPGPILLQSLSGDFRFRNIRIRPIK